MWDEAAILAEIDRMEALIAPIAEPASDGERTQAIDRTREFVRTRADVLLAELAAVLTFYDPATETTSGGGLLLGGTLTFGEASREGGAAVVGSITGEVIEL